MRNVGVTVYLQGKSYTNVAGDKVTAKSFQEVTSCCRRKCYEMSLDNQSE